MTQEELNIQRWFYQSEAIRTGKMLNKERNMEKTTKKSTTADLRKDLKLTYSEWGKLVEYNKMVDKIILTVEQSKLETVEKEMAKGMVAQLYNFSKGK